MRMSPQGIQFVPVTPMVKKLLIVSLVSWFFLVMILQNFFLTGQPVFYWLGLVPHSLFTQFTIWQPLTYIFVHSTGIFHVVFNMLLLWWLGAELEMRWGGKFFLTYYLVCGVGAAFIYLVSVGMYALVTGNYSVLLSPVVGASGSVFGLLLAYGLLFGDRVFYFFMLFPMKAKYFVMILAAIELLSVLGSGVGGPVANLAHLGGLVSGFVFLWGWGRWKARGPRRGGPGQRRGGPGLKLVVDNERDRPGQGGPKYWN